MQRITKITFGVLFGIGISHAPLIDATVEGGYSRPLATTRAYLDAILALRNLVLFPGVVSGFGASQKLAVGPFPLSIVSTCTGRFHMRNRPCSVPLASGT